MICLVDLLLTPKKDLKPDFFGEELLSRSLSIFVLFEEDRFQEFVECPKYWL